MLKSPTFTFVLCVYVCLNRALSGPVITDVRLTCHNFKNVLYWNYSAPDPNPEFSITIRGYENADKSVLTTNQTYLDISEYTQHAEDGYSVQLTAQANGSELKNSSARILFSYNENIPTDFKCVVDFPPLKLSVTDRRVNLSFTHPFYFHNAESLNDYFSCKISYNKTERICEPCYVEDVMCTEEFELSESLYGKCMDVHIMGSVNGIPTEIDKKVCGPEAPIVTDWTMIITILLCSGFSILLLTIWGVIMYKKLIQSDSQSALSKLLGIVKADHVNVPEQPTLSKVTSVGHTPLLETTDQIFVDTSTSKFEDNSHFPNHFISNVALTEKQEHPDEEEEEEDEADSEVFDSGNSFSGYDSHKFPIDMGQGDIVEAYGPR
ncbi:interferon gamma receptor 1-like [Tachysurus fulvidraco]|uniref:interferon gamma receptor 1-like n=1 Tax=Tachysurus fulvidraco TaxID=1234273 RepID=UPI001FF0500E|nr:interferon gamma receptor 1-like [Tachysurus fulvidraco]XP_027021486.2 interferon gamma receptor 1-like [Tachysurus fulvidraco]